MSRKLSISVPDQMNEEIEELVARGIFSSKTAVIEEGLRMVFMRYAGFEYETLRERIQNAVRL